MDHLHTLSGETDVEIGLSVLRNPQKHHYFHHMVAGGGPPGSMTWERDRGVTHRYYARQAGGQAGANGPAVSLMGNLRLQ